MKNLSDTVEYSITRNHSTDKIIALAGNPNVGKSTVFVVTPIWNNWS